MNFVAVKLQIFHRQLAQVPIARIAGHGEYVNIASAGKANRLECLERLRFAKDKSEFDQFMAERRRASDNSPPAPQS